MIKAVGRVLLGFVFFFVVLTIYTIWDNNRIKVVKQDIVIDDLPGELEGFKIVQVTDLHEKIFGDNQARLIKTINSIDYDAIVFTGDMLISGNSRNYEPFYTMLDGINNKEHALFVPGNSDPSSYIVDRDKTLKKHEFIKGMEFRGVKLLESIHSFEKGSTFIHFVDFELSILNAQNRAPIPTGVKSANASLIQHRIQLLEELPTLDSADDSDVLIALNHYPIVDARIDNLINDPNLVIRDFDLIMAGHYHGGQIRLPLIGALFVPEPYYDNSGFFPPQDRIKGLWEYKQTKQYVSAGLGSSQTISFLKFRLFNTPEINVLSLKNSR